MANLRAGQVIYRLQHKFSSGHSDNRYMFVAGEQIKNGKGRYALLIATTSETNFPNAKENEGCNQSKTHDYSCYFIKAERGLFPKDTYLDFTKFDNSVILECGDLDKEVTQNNRDKNFRFSDIETLNILNCAKNSIHLPGWVIKTIENQIDYYQQYNSFP